MEGQSDDDGLATVFSCLAIGILLLVTGIGIHLGAAMLSRQRAETAADLGALAGAARALQGTEVVCARSRAVVAANGAGLTSCTVEGLDVLVEVQYTGGGWGRTATAHARAGPVGSP